MKKLLLVLVIGFLCSWQSASADFLGIYKTTDTIQFGVNLAIDSSGIYGAPDSIQVFTRLNNAATATYKATGAAYACAGVDTGAEYGGTQAWYKSAIADIDGAGGTTYGLSIDVYSWYKKLPIQTHANILVISNSLDAMLDASMDSSAIAATRLLALQDTITVVHTLLAATRDSVYALHTLALAERDSVKAIHDLLLAQRDSLMALHVLNLALRDSGSIVHTAILGVPLATWNVAFNTAFTAGSMGDSLNNFTAFATFANLLCDSIFLSRGGATGAAITALRDSLHAARLRIDSIEAKLDSSKAVIYATWDSLLSGAFGGGTGGLDSATVEFIVAKVSQDSAFAKVGLNRKWHLSNLIILDAFKDDTGGIFAHSDSDIAIYGYSLDNWGLRISNSDGNNDSIGSAIFGGNIWIGNGSNQGILGFIRWDSSTIKLRDSVNVLHVLALAERDSLHKVRTTLDSVQSELLKVADSLHATNVLSVASRDSLHKVRTTLDSVQGELLKAADSVHVTNVLLVASRDSLHQARLRTDSILAIVFDSAKFGRQVWDNDIVAQVLRLVEVNTKTGFKLAVDGLDTDSSFTALQAQMAKVIDSLQAALDSLQLSDDHYRSLFAQIDTAGMYGMNKLVSKSITAYHDDRDTVWYLNDTDTMFYDVYYHVGGAEGNPPDSVKRTAM